MELVYDAKEEEGVRYQIGDVEASSRGLLFMTSQTVLGVYICFKRKWLLALQLFVFEHVFARNCEAAITGR